MSERPDTDGTDEIVCPYCGQEFSDSLEFIDQDGDDIDCDACGKSFELTVNHSVTYSTSRKDCENDAHEWGEADMHVMPQKDCDRWNREAFMKRTDWTPHALWIRECKCCDDKEYKCADIGAPNPFTEALPT